MGRSSRRIWAAILMAGLVPVMTGGLGLRSNLEERLLAAHNRERAALGLEPLAWDPELAAHASAWSGELAQSDVMQHAEQESDDPQGENLWAGTTGAYSPEGMVGSWAEEKAQFRPGRFPEVSRTGHWKDVGHYTQMVWRETDRVGCAVAAGADFDYLVCRYRTAGNVIGEPPF
jgi:hypothetical protein